ncbi:MAG: adenosine deaminase [Vagococcus fluvialis]|uniref:adenosine deaminase n=1 Tax=Vagococcus fluvialis TaxID=2738 RepID=UPI000A3397DE|nr:adenosine deaminase [Vagococcus fluvialis]MBO0418836.1 adenosine deaminase [Vagococcus fluvialis]OTP31194.1 adenosine deaminase [Enterococcus sp. 6C8_DIV0013]
MTTNVTLDFIKGLPKAELHLHLEGTLEPDLKLKLAQKNKVDIGQTTIEEVQASYQFDSLPSFLNIYYPAMNVLQDEEDFYELAMAYLRNAKEQGIKRAELFFDPQAHTTRGVSFETVINGYYRAIEESDTLGISADLIMCFLRDMSAESAEETLQQALPYKDKFIAVGLDSDEKGNPPSKFAKVFAKAREAGLKLTMHCDIDQENSIEHIRQVIEDIKVDRIDHGTNIVEDQKLVDYVNEHNIGLTSCPVSNGFVVDDMKGKEIIELLEQGVKVTVNSDDPAYFQSYISDDLFALATKYDMTKEQIVQLAKNSFEISWISEEEKNNYLTMIDEYVANN